MLFSFVAIDASIYVMAWLYGPLYIDFRTTFVCRHNVVRY